MALYLPSAANSAPVAKTEAWQPAAKVPYKPLSPGNASFRATLNNQPQAFKDAYKEWEANPGVISALGSLNAPFEAAGQYAGDFALEKTGSPALATLGYLGGSGMFGTAPLKGLPFLGKEGLRMVDQGLTHGQGPLSALQHLAPGVMKREGGNWFPGEVDRQVENLKAFAPNAEIKKWIAGPMKNYIQKRFASPNDEIRKLYDQGINTTTEASYLTAADRKFATATRPSYADSSLGNPQYGITDRAKSWEDLTDSYLAPDTLLADTFAKKLAKNKLRDAELVPDLPNPGHRRDAIAGDQAGFDNWRTVVDNWHSTTAHNKAVKEATTIREKNLDNVAGIREQLSKGESWLDSVPLDMPINSFRTPTVPLKDAYNLAGIPEFRHIFDVMGEDMAAGLLTPQQLNTGSYSVDAAARRANTYNVAKEKAMAEARQVAAPGFPVIKEYDTGHKWVELKHNTDDAATAAELKSEGNAMGHCVGGYCDDVLSGAKRIISLRDPKGKSRATIELSEPHNSDVARIVQIKGPANRKPGAAEIPMIQDFIKNNGPFQGDIGDFQNTDLQNLDVASKFNGDIGDFQNTDLQNPDVASKFNGDAKYFNGDSADMAGSSNKLKDFSDWAKQTAVDQGHPYMDKDELLQNYTRITGNDGPVY